MAEMAIRRLGVLSVAKMYGLLLAIMGLIFGVIYGLIFIFFGAAMALGARNDAGTAGGVGSAVIGILMMVGIPIIYGIMGFIVGALMAIIYNIVAGFAGGVHLELESISPSYTAPPAPPQWSANAYPSGQ